MGSAFHGSSTWANQDMHLMHSQIFCYFASWTLVIAGWLTRRRELLVIALGIAIVGFEWGATHAVQ